MGEPEANKDGGDGLNTGSQQQFGEETILISFFSVVPGPGGGGGVKRDACVRGGSEEAKSCKQTHTHTHTQLLFFLCRPTGGNFSVTPRWVSLHTRVYLPIGLLSV